MLDRHISHSDIQSFADEVVNLRREDAKVYREQVQRLRVKLEQHIADHPGFDLVKMLNSGSVAKGTALSTINDMDVAVYVKAGAAPADEARMLDWTAARLRDAYGGIVKPDQINPEHHCVRVSFRGTGLDVDVVPVWYEGAANDFGYLIPPSTGERVLTSIPLHIAFTRSKKNAHSDFAQLVRLVKWWAAIQKRERDGFRFKSFMAELLLAHLFDAGVLKSGNYADALFQFFSYIVRTKLSQPIVFTEHYDAKAVQSDGKLIQIFDPVNPANNVASRYGHKERELIVEASEDALDALAMARRATTKGQATIEWQVIFGKSFKV